MVVVVGSIAGFVIGLGVIAIANAFLGHWAHNTLRGLIVLAIAYACFGLTPVVGSVIAWRRLFAEPTHDIRER